MTMKTLISFLLLCVATLALGCPQTIEIEVLDRRPDAAVVRLPLRGACTHEVREVGSVVVAKQGSVPAVLVRGRNDAYLVRTEPASGDDASTLTIDRVTRDGNLERAGTTTKTGAAGDVLGMDTAVGGESLLVALTRPAGRIDLLTLGFDGADSEPAQTIESGREGRAEVHWFRGVPLVTISGSALHADGSSFQLAAGQPDGGAAVPSDFETLVTAGKTLGWLRRSDEGYWLEHYLDGDTGVLSLKVSPSPAGSPDVLWAGDRYLIGDPPHADIGRYIIARTRRGKSAGTTHLRLGGRIVLPRPRGEVTQWSWDSAGPAHLGLAQVLGTRYLQFVNVALAGQVLDAAVQYRRERDILSTDVVWDGSGYVLAWSEREDEGRAALYLARFTCPDESR